MLTTDARIEMLRGQAVCLVDTETQAARAYMEWGLALLRGNFRCGGGPAARRWLELLARTVAVQLRNHYTRLRMDLVSLQDHPSSRFSIAAAMQGFRRRGDELIPPATGRDTTITAGSRAAMAVALQRHEQRAFISYLCERVAVRRSAFTVFQVFT